MPTSHKFQQLLLRSVDCDEALARKKINRNYKELEIYTDIETHQLNVNQYFVN
jgi:hypothetical protein